MRIREGYLFFKKRYPSLTPSQRKYALRACSLKSCTRCAIRCGVHGFAMNPCELLLLSTAPYYREARVTVARRQTACRMRHCCARRIVECLDRRELLRTFTRWAERQRIIEAEANRIATATRLRRAMAVQSASIAALRAARLQCEFSLGGFKGGISLFEKEISLPYPHSCAAAGNLQAYYACNNSQYGI